MTHVFNEVAVVVQKSKHWQTIRIKLLDAKKNQCSGGSYQQLHCKPVCTSKNQNDRSTIFRHEKNEHDNHCSLERNYFLTDVCITKTKPKLEHVNTLQRDHFTEEEFMALV
jgi:hypothetical protein